MWNTTHCRVYCFRRTCKHHFFIMRLGIRMDTFWGVDFNTIFILVIYTVFIDSLIFFLLLFYVFILIYHCSLTIALSLYNKWDPTLMFNSFVHVLVQVLSLWQMSFNYLDFIPTILLKKFINNANKLSKASAFKHRSAHINILTREATCMCKQAGHSSCIL